MNPKKIKQTLKSNIELVASLMAGLFFIAIIVPYLINFGSGWSNSNEVWGQFGDYVGGSLNPIFGLITLLVILFNTRMQRREMENNREMMLTQSKIMNRQLELVEQKAIEEFTFQLLEEVRTDSLIKKAKSKQWAALLGIYMLYVDDSGKYAPDSKAYGERSALADDYFRSSVGITLGEFIHSIYPKMLALVVCVNKLPRLNQIFITNLVKTRFGMAVISALIHFAHVMERREEYAEFAKLHSLLQGAGDSLVFSEKVCADFLIWLDAEQAQANMMKSRDKMAALLSQSRNQSNGD